MIVSSASSRTLRVLRLSLAGSAPWLAMHASVEESGPAAILAAAESAEFTSSRVFLGRKRGAFNFASKEGT
jgi:hypothetical protein